MVTPYIFLLPALSLFRLLLTSVRRSPRFLPPTSSASGSGSSPRPTLLEPSLHNITASPCDSSPPRLVLDPLFKEFDTFSCSSLELKMDTLYLC